MGLGPWGEQLLLKLKWYTLLHYDAAHQKIGCPHNGCVHLADTDLYHVFWDCPAARTLRQLMTRTWLTLGIKSSAIEHAIFSMKLLLMPAGVWRAADKMYDHHITLSNHFMEAVTMLAESCWRLGAAILLQRGWRWRVNHFDSLAKVSEQSQAAAFKWALWQGYSTVFTHTAAQLHPTFGPLAIQLMRRVLTSESVVDYLQFTDRGATKYLLFFNRGGGGGPVAIRGPEAAQ